MTNCSCVAVVFNQGSCFQYHHRLCNRNFGIHRSADLCWSRELQDATNNFSDKIGKGGFGSVYLGKLSDASRVAVKKLE